MGYTSAPAPETSPSATSAAQSAPSAGESPKSRLVAFLLAFFLGYLGVQRFYVGKNGTGLLMLLTFGGVGVWWFIDWIMILVGAFRDQEGRPVKSWDLK